MKSRMMVWALVLAWVAGGALAWAGTLVQIKTPKGIIDVELFDVDKPVTVKNFLRYAEGGAYTNMFFHRLVTNFVMQGGGYRVLDPRESALATRFYAVPTLPPITNEFNVGRRISNTAGTVAMAKLPNDPNSATSQWFFNLANNSANLDNQNGGFTVFGRVIGGMDVLQSFNALEPGAGVVDLRSWYGAGAAEFQTLPVTYTGFTPPFYPDLMYVEVKVLRMSVTLGAADARVITWNSISNRLNHVEFRSGALPVWQTLATRMGNGQNLSVTDLAPATGSRLYRIRIEY